LDQDAVADSQSRRGGWAVAPDLSVRPDHDGDVLAGEDMRVGVAGEDMDVDRAGSDRDDRPPEDVGDAWLAERPRLRTAVRLAVPAMLLGHAVAFRLARRVGLLARAVGPVAGGVGLVAGDVFGGRLIRRRL